MQRCRRSRRAFTGAEDGGGGEECARAQQARGVWAVGVGSGDQRCGAGRRERGTRWTGGDWRGQRRMVMTDEREGGSEGFFFRGPYARV